MFLIITRDTMFFTAMKNILSKGNVVHIQNEEEIDVMLHQNAFVIIDTLMNNVFHSNFLTQIERLKPVHVIIFSPFNIKRCLGKVPVPLFRGLSLSLILSHSSMAVTALCLKRMCHFRASNIRF